MRTPAYLVTTSYNIVLPQGGPYNFPTPRGGCYLSRCQPTREAAEKEVATWHSEQAREEGWLIVKVVEVVDYTVVRSYRE